MQIRLISIQILFKLYPKSPTTILPLLGIVLPSSMEDEVEPIPPPADPPPEVSDASTLGGWIWVVLFGVVMAASVIANGYLCVCVCQSRKKQNLVYFLLILVFLVNLADYGLMVFDFSLGIEHQYPHGQTACSVYQTVSKVNPVIQASIMLILASYASKHYNSQGTPEGGGGGRQEFSKKMASALIAMVLIFLYGVLAIAPANFATIVTIEEKRYCEIITLGKNHQMNISIFYLTYSAVLCFWLPLMLSFTPMIRLAKTNRPDKYPEVSVVLATVTSFFVFYFLHGCVVLVRHTLDAIGMDLDHHHLWMIKVAQSLLWLVAYFWHVTRPILAFLMDSDLRGQIGGCGGCLRFSANSHDLDDYDCCNLSDRFHNNSGNGNPLQQVLLTPSGEEANEFAITKKVNKQLTENENKQLKVTATPKNCDESHSNNLLV